MPTFAHHIIFILVSSVRLRQKLMIWSISSMMPSDASIALMWIFKQCISNYNLFHFRNKLLAAETTLEKLPPGEETLSEIQAVVEQINQMQNLSCRVVDYFRSILEKVDELRYKPDKVQLLLASLSQKPANSQTKLIVLGNAYANIDMTWSNLTPRRMPPPRKRIKCWVGG